MNNFCKTLKDTISAYKWWAEIAVKSYLGEKKKGHYSPNKHLALLAWSFPPSVSGGVYRPKALVRYGTELGWSMSVISGPIIDTPNLAGTYLLNTLPKGLRISRLNPPNMKPSYNWFPRVDGGFLNAIATFSLAQKLYDNDPPAIVMATGPTFHNFIAAYYIARFYKSKLVLDYRDEWMVNTQKFINPGNVDKKWESCCLHYADAVFFVTQSMLDLYSDAFPELDKAKCRVIRNGWEPSDFMPNEKIPQGVSMGKSKILLSHVGTLGPHLPLGEFLDALEKVFTHRKDLKEQFKLRFVGKGTKGEAGEQLLNFRYHELIDVNGDYVPKPQAIRMMQESTILLLLNRKYAIPGKLYDYLAAGPPILSFGDTGEVGNIITELNAGILVPIGNTDALERALDTLADGKYQKRNYVEINKWLNLHTRKVMAQKMVEVFNQFFNTRQ